MIVKLLTEHHLELLSLKGVCTGSPESTLVKLPHCWKSHDATHIYAYMYIYMLPFTNTGGMYIQYIWAGEKITEFNDQPVVPWQFGSMLLA